MKCRLQWKVNIEFSKLENEKLFSMVVCYTSVKMHIEEYIFMLTLALYILEQQHHSIEEKSTLLDTTTPAILVENGKALEVNDAKRRRNVVYLSVSTIYQTYCAFTKRASFDRIFISYLTRCWVYLYTSNICNIYHKIPTYLYLTHTIQQLSCKLRLRYKVH